MAAFLNRTTKHYVSAGNTPDYPAADWIENPDLSAVAGVPFKYWKVVGDTVVEMGAEEKAAVDASEVAAAEAASPFDPDKWEGVPLTEVEAINRLAAVVGAATPIP
jgi:hypothetical protein